MVGINESDIWLVIGGFVVSWILKKHVVIIIGMVVDIAAMTREWILNGEHSFLFS